MIEEAITTVTETVTAGARGVRPLKPRLDRPSPYGLRWWVDGKPRTEFFVTEEERDRRMAKVLKERERGVTPLNSSEIREYRTIKNSLGDVPWQDVLSGYRQWMAVSQRAVTKRTVALAVTEYLAEIKERLAEDTYRHRKTYLDRMALAFGDRDMGDVRPDELRRWLPSTSPITHNGVRKSLHAFFAWHGGVNPVKDVPLMETVHDTIGVLTPEQTVQLFTRAAKANRNLIGRLACEAFAGIRFSSACRLEKKDVTPGEGINLPASKFKTKRRHYIDDLPANLWAWFDLDDGTGWEMPPHEYMYRKSLLFVAADVPHPKNALRHSFATYYTAAYKDPGKTALILGHRNQQLLWRAYLGRATKDQGNAYFAIKPPGAL
jgi:hypothetical protein